MSNAKLTGARRLTKARARGQSLPLIGLMIVVLVAMVGLSVDVGNTFQNEREAVAAANAASIAGMNVVARKTGTTNSSVYTAIRNSLTSNGVDTPATFGAEPTGGQLRLEAFYLNSQGQVLTPGGVIDGSGKAIPANVSFIQVNLSGVVGTYFARVVGRPDLPINATAYAGTCPPGQGYYPIGVNDKLLEGNKFKNPGDLDPIDGKPDKSWRTITSGTYAGYTAMRMDVQDGPSSGGFSWFRWQKTEKSAVDLADSLTFPGNLSTGFTEADWPYPTGKPENYPLNPGVLNRGDWVWTATGYKSSADDEMNLHVNEGTRMILPIYDQVEGTGINARFKIVDFGVFVVLDHGKVPQGNEKFIELVFLGRNINQDEVCGFSTAPDPSQTYDLVGEVSLRPEYAYNPNARRPIQYVVVLDVSGSMSANFAGQCDKFKSSGKNPPAKGYWQCANGPDGAPLVEVEGTGPDYFWNNVDQRRITVAKRALESLVRSTNMPGNTGYDNTRPDDQMAIVWFNEKVNKTTGNISVFTNGNFTNVVGSQTTAGSLVKAVYDAGSYSSDTFRTQGGTNGAAGLYRAALAFDTVPKDVTMPSGQKFDYKRVVVFITDGVSNQFLNKNNGDLHGGESNQDTYPSGHICKVPLVKEMATCQVTGNATSGGGVYNGMDRPITQAGNVSKQDLQPKGVEVYAIALSNIADTGLKDSIASFPSYFFSADTLEYSGGKSNVQQIMEVINTRVEGGLCEARTDAMDGNSEWRTDIPAGQFQSIAGLTYPNVGEVILTGTSGTFRVPIIANSAGQLSYSKSDIPIGTYKLQAYLYYRHPLDPAGTQPRMYSMIDQADQSQPSITLFVPPAGGTVGLSGQIKQDLRLKLTGYTCATTP